MFIWSWHKLGAITTYKDYTAEFFKNHYHPYLAEVQKKKAAEAPNVATA